MTQILYGRRVTPAGEVQQFYPTVETVTPAPSVTYGSATVGTASYALPTTNALYVATTGSDANPGTVGSPKQTLKGAMAAATNGTTIVMRAGTYNEGGDTQTGGTATDARSAMASGLGSLFNSTKTNITIQNYPGEPVWIDGSVQFDTSWQFDAPSGLWWHSYDRRFNQSHMEGAGSDDTGTGGAATGGYWVSTSSALNLNASWPDMILRDGTELKVVTTQAACVSGTVYVQGNYATSPAPAVVSGVTQQQYWFQGTKVWVADDPTGHEMRYSNKCMLLQFNTGPLTIRGIGIRRYASFQSGQGAFYLQNCGVTFENVWFEHFSALGFKASGAANSTFRNCTMHYFGFGFWHGSGNNLTFDSCDFQYHNWRKFNPGGPTLGILKIEGSSNITVKNSNFSDSHCKAFWTDRTADTVYIYSSYFQRLGDQITGFIGGTACAVDFEGTSNGLVADCLITQIGGYGIWNNDSSACRYYNNTVVDTHRSGIDATGHIIGGGPFTIGQSDRRPWENGTNYKNNYTWMNTFTSTFYNDPDHQFACRNFWLYNNVFNVSQANVLGGPAQTLFSCQSQADTSIANPAVGGVPDGQRTFDKFYGTGGTYGSGGMDSNVYWTEVALQYAFFIITNGASVGPTIHWSTQGISLSHFHTAWPALETNGTQRAFGAGGNPLNSSYQVTDASLHTKATPLPADIAALIGQPTGVKRAGSFLVGG